MPLVIEEAYAFTLNEGRCKGFTVMVPNNYLHELTKSGVIDLAAMVADKLATKIADTYLAEHQAEVLAKLNPEAIASLAIAQAGQAIAKTNVLPTHKTININETRHSVDHRW
jgi:hypothetical protein